MDAHENWRWAVEPADWDPLHAGRSHFRKLESVAIFDTEKHGGLGIEPATRLDPVRSRHSGRGAWGHAPCEFPCPHAVRVDTQRRFPPRTRNTRRRDAGVTTRTGTARRHHTPHTAIPHRHGRTHVHPQDDSDTRILDVLCYAMYYDGRGGSFGLPELGSRRSRLAARAACALARGGSERCRPVSGLQRTSPCPTTIAHKAQ